MPGTLNTSLAAVRALLEGGVQGAPAALFQRRKLAEAALQGGIGGHVVARFLSAAADQVVRCCYEALAPASGALLAVGGYGRGELAPFSDLDLLFLDAGDGAGAAAAERAAPALWDLGLKIGHAVRGIDECLSLARDDHTVHTALLEARQIGGDSALSETLLRRFRREVVEPGFVGFASAKLKERDERHARAGVSRYMVEPNIKEGKGGLRDLHTLFWLARHRYGYATPRRYLEAGLVGPEEWIAFRRAIIFLWTVRCNLHVLAGRAEERLTFDLQPEMARRLGFATRSHETAVERFMKRYFLVARQVGSLTRTMCARLEADQVKPPPQGIRRFLPRRRSRKLGIAAGFSNEGGRLNIESREALASATGLMTLFATAAAHDLDIHPAALGEAARRARRMPMAWRCDRGACDLFLRILDGKRPAPALRLMNEAGVLGKFLPEFGRVVGRMQFNMYHHYTVDEHTLRALAALSEIEEGLHKTQHPLATLLMAKVERRRALMLAVLLHDVGKAGADQSRDGESAARNACERLGLGRDDIELVAWLVRNHLAMSDTAQRRDLGDPHTIAQFASLVGDVAHLQLLLLVTVVDIRAVGPNIWNDWKGKLLRDLYRLTERALVTGSSAAGPVQDVENAKAALSSGVGIDPAWLAAWDDGYWLAHSHETQAWHAKVAREAAEETPHVAFRRREREAVTEVLVLARDRPGLFASLAAAISTAGADIVRARAHTARDGLALDVFSLQSVDHRPFGADDPARLRRLATRLRRAALADALPPEAPAPSRRRAAFRIESWVRIDNDASAGATVAEASGRDRLGLLCELARACADAGASIVSAHINTLGERASDVFYVQAADGAKLSSPEAVGALKRALELVLEEDEPVPPATAGKKSLAVARASTAR